MTKTTQRRLEALEARAGDPGAAWVCYTTAAAFNAARAAGAIPAGVKVYVGVCPNDWDHEQDTAAAAA